MKSRQEKQGGQETWIIKFLRGDKYRLLVWRIKVNAINGNYQDIVCRESWGQSGTGGGYELAVTNAGKIRLDLYQSHNQYTTAIGSTTITTNAWHHVVGVFDGNQIRIYLNGVLDRSVSTTNGPASGTSALHIGKSTRRRC